MLLICKVQSGHMNQQVHKLPVVSQKVDLREKFPIYPYLLVFTKLTINTKTVCEICSKLTIKTPEHH